MRKKRTGSLVGSVGIGQGEMVSNIKRGGFRQDIRKKVFYYESSESLELVAQRCGHPLRHSNSVWMGL